MIKALFKLNTLSVDVALGAVASSAFFSIVFRTEISLLALISLGLSVWIIYTADHLLDVKNCNVTLNGKRHSFHQAHYSILLRIVSVAIIVDLVIVCTLPYSIIYTGIVLGLFVVLYLLFSKKLGASKELMAAVFYTSGVCVPALSLSELQIPINDRLILIQFFTAVLINLILFALIDKNEDKANRFNSIATLKSPIQVRFLLLLLLVFSLGLFLIIQQSGSNLLPSSILFLMVLILGLLFAFRKSTFVKTYYRLIGDGAFLLPILILLS